MLLTPVRAKAVGWGCSISWGDRLKNKLILVGDIRKSKAIFAGTFSCIP